MDKDDLLASIRVSKRAGLFLRAQMDGLVRDPILINWDDIAMQCYEVVSEEISKASKGLT